MSAPVDYRTAKVYVDGTRVKQLCIVSLAAERFWHLAFHERRGPSTLRPCHVRSVEVLDVVRRSETRVNGKLVQKDMRKCTVWSNHACARTSNQLRKRAQQHAKGEKTQTAIFPSTTSARTCTRYLSSELSSESSHLTVEATFGFLHMLRVRLVHNLKVVLGLSPV